MEIVSIIIIAIALAMDAFSVSICAGMYVAKPTFNYYFRLSFFFGFFQAIMPILGYFCGKYIEDYIKLFDHWVAFGLLLIIGLKMIHESFESCEIPKRDPSKGLTLLIFSIATSIDALAVGLSFGVLHKPIIIPSIIIGVVCALFSIFGIFLGNKMKLFSKKRASMIGGLMLIAIGIKIIFEHRDHIPFFQ